MILSDDSYDSIWWQLGLYLMTAMTISYEQLWLYLMTAMTIPYEQLRLYLMTAVTLSDDSYDFICIWWQLWLYLMTNNFILWTALALLLEQHVQMYRKSTQSFKINLPPPPLPPALVNIHAPRPRTCDKMSTKASHKTLQEKSTWFILTHLHTHTHHAKRKLKQFWFHPCHSLGGVFFQQQNETRLKVGVKY